MLNKRLRMLRIHHKYTQQSMADLLHLTLNSYQKYEQGATAPPLQTLVKIADIFNTSTDFLLGRDAYLQSVGLNIDIDGLEDEKTE